MVGKYLRMLTFECKQCSVEKIRYPKPDRLLGRIFPNYPQVTARSGEISLRGNNATR